MSGTLRKRKCFSKVQRFRHTANGHFSEVLAPPN